MILVLAVRLSLISPLAARHFYAVYIKTMLHAMFYSPYTVNKTTEKYLFTVYRELGRAGAVGGQATVRHLSLQQFFLIILMDSFHSLGYLPHFPSHFNSLKR